MCFFYQLGLGIWWGIVSVYPLPRIRVTHEGLFRNSVLKGIRLTTWRIIPGLGSMVNWPMVIVSPLRIGLWAPFQMAFLWPLKGVSLTTYKSWDDPPSTVIWELTKTMAIYTVYLGFYYPVIWGLFHKPWNIPMNQLGISWNISQGFWTLLKW